jgi:hypothetical protein
MKLQHAAWIWPEGEFQENDERLQVISRKRRLLYINRYKMFYYKRLLVKNNIL